MAYIVSFRIQNLQKLIKKVTAESFTKYVTETLINGF